MTELLSKIFIKNYKDTKDPTVRAQYGTLSGIVGIITNFFLSALKLFVGVLTASVAITADALNNLSDAGASVISLVSFKMSSKPADRDHPFGHERIEYIASMIVSFLILLVGFEMIADSIKTLLGLQTRENTDFTILSLVLISISILIKLWLSFFYRKIGKKIESTVVIASSQDSLFDCISTSAVLISSIIIKFTNFYIIDAIVGLGVSVLIIVAGIRILNETKNSLLGEAPIKEIVDGMLEIVSRYPEIIDTHDLMVHNYGPRNFIASFHAEVDGKSDIYVVHDIIDNVEKQIKNELGILCTIHLDPIITDNEKITELHDITKSIIKSIDERIGFHDFRVVMGATHTNLIFDIEIPFEISEPCDKIVKTIEEKIKAQRNECFCVITVDRC